MFIRNPLERLVSAFRNKLEKPLEIWNIYNQTFQMITRSIIQRYHPGDYKRWIDSKGSFELKLDFHTYIRWIVDTPNQKLNEHFSPVIHIAQPCRVRYNFYGNFKQFSSDMHKVMDKLSVPSEYFFDKSYYTTGGGTNTMLQTYYSSVSADVKAALFKDFYAELDFYYHLYPEESDSHIKLLGLE